MAGRSIIALVALSGALALPVPALAQGATAPDSLAHFLPLDLATLRLCSILASVTFTVILLALWRGRKEYSYNMHWAGSLVLYCFALAGLEWVNRSDGLLIRSLLLVTLVASNILVVTGVRLFAGKPIWRWWMAVPPVATLVGFLIPHAFTGIGIARLAQSEKLFAASGLILAMGVFGLDIMRQADRAVPDGYGGRIAGMAMMAYIPCYLFSIAGDFFQFATPDTLATVALLSDQLLLMLTYLALIAMPAEAAFAELKENAWRDGLTGVYNRAWLSRKSEEFLKQGTWIAHIDVDHFKSINDRFGHSAGDATLIGLANALVAATQNREMNCAGQVVRMGGDEFLIIMPDASMLVAQRLVQNIRTAIMQVEPFVWTVSIGLSMVNGEDTSLNDVVERADQQLYSAKLAGRDRVAA